VQGDPGDRGVLPSWFDDMWMTAAAVSCGMPRETVKRSDLAGHGGHAVLRLAFPSSTGFKLWRWDCRRAPPPAFWHN
jgi:hypothetical protein